MKLEYEVIEDSFDDTTHIRTMSEQARMTSGGWLLRTTVYSPHHISVDVTLIPNADSNLFEPLVD